MDNYCLVVSAQLQIKEAESQVVKPKYIKEVSTHVLRFENFRVHILQSFHLLTVQEPFMVIFSHFPIRPLRVPNILRVKLSTNKIF